jgi:UDP-2-acetamido-2,6-beta-L-arabino-hexul-4-ose reductase
MPMLTIAVTGANGFIGSNLAVQLRERGFTVVPVPHESDDEGLLAALGSAEAVVHLAGVNRPREEADFATGNEGFTARLVAALQRLARPLPVLYASSIQVGLDNPYGRSKRAAEEALAAYSERTGAPVAIFRLPNVFGKWCRPNYNSVVATFAHNIAHGLPITISDPGRMLPLVYVDDVVAAFIAVLADPARPMPEVQPVYRVSLGALAETLQRFRDSRQTLITGPVGAGLERALHATYLSYLKPAQFDYALTRHTDPRGTFAEMLRTPDAGQFSYFTAHPGITRGGHYHHTKTEKFLVLNGRARFGFRHILTGETYELVITGEEARVVETIPGWAHDITNIGDDTMVVMLWANEVFDRERPDTVAAKVLDA